MLVFLDTKNRSDYFFVFPGDVEDFPLVVVFVAIEKLTL